MSLPPVTHFQQNHTYSCKAYNAYNSYNSYNSYNATP